MTASQTKEIAHACVDALQRNDLEEAGFQLAQLYLCLIGGDTYAPLCALAYGATHPIPDGVIWTMHLERAHEAINEEFALS